MFLLSSSVVPATAFFAVALICFSSSALADAVLPAGEVKALREIGKSLGRDWDFDVDPCSGQSGWAASFDKDTADNVVCQISPADNTNHVVNISLKSQSLPGVLPPALVKLPFLRVFDVSRNYLNGTIPPEWGLMRSIEIISLLGNRLTGSIPKEMGNLSTLTEFVVEINQLSGPLPPELGNLTQIQRLVFTSNNFTGDLPPSFENLVALTDLRLDDNNFTGQIPEFIGKLKILTKLFIRASGLQGPIPNSIELLDKLEELTITDLNGPEMQFPNITSSSIKYLILRSCNITGSLPGYLAGRTNLKTLDFSFNKLNGTIPDNYSKIDFDDLFLTSNQLTGKVQDWILNQNENNIDVSYNNFNASSSAAECSGSKTTVNLFASSSKGNTSRTVTCLKECSKYYYNLYINCGGKEETIKGKRYYDDSNDGGASRFFSNSSYKWGYSNTGYFLEGNQGKNVYTITNQSALSIKDPRLYMQARISPISLTYYAVCLRNGTYRLSLHFAEIIFTNDRNYSSLGRRIFDVYVQGKQELKDFDIAAAAGGAGKEIVIKFPVTVSDGTVEIRFYWAGKGTTAIPTKGVYGPLISAISLESDSKPPMELSTGVIVGIVVAIACSVFLIIGILWWRRRLRLKGNLDQDLKGLDLKTGSFTLRQIKAATNNFDPAYKIGEGGFGSVFKGFLSDGAIIAVKQLSSKSNQGNREFLNEIGMISALQHPHLVKLYGCCIEGNQLLLVYEYMENNSLAHALFGSKEHQLKLDWLTRYRICVGIARGLAYLHEESRLKIVHRDIKATNVLLDKDLIPKISDFGLAKLAEEDNTHISTRVAGTFGYMAPEYAMRGYLTDKADVYSFGIVALEIISGKCNTSGKQKDKCFYLLDWASVLKEKGDLIELVDPRLGSDFNKDEAITMINVALLCTNVSPAVRPAMSSVVSMLEGTIQVEAPPPHDVVITDEENVAIMRKHFRGISSEEVSQEIIESFQIEGPQTASSTSANDLYPINLDSEYLLRRN